MIENEKNIITYLDLPSIPKLQWDGKSSFTRGVAVTRLLSGIEAYAVATYDSERDSKPRIIKVFTIEPYTDFKIVGVVPDYMDVEGVDGWDLSDESKRAAKSLIEEAQQLEVEGIREERTDLPKNEYMYDNINNDEEARAFIKTWNKRHGMKRAHIPSSHEDIISKLTAMWLNENKNN